MIPPGYRKGTIEEHCSNCGAYRVTPNKRYSGFCQMFHVQVANANVCDKWYARVKRKIKLRRGT